MIWIVLGGAVGVWSELSLASVLAPAAKIIATNDAGARCPKPIDAWVTLHPEKLQHWVRQRRLNIEHNDYQLFSIENICNAGVVPEKWAGSSGLYAVQIALECLGASGVILCGCPLTKSGRHFFDKNNQWSDAEVYRKGFKAAFPVIHEKVRSMSGWTRELLGEPTTQWLIDRA